MTYDDDPRRPSRAEAVRDELYDQIETHPCPYTPNINALQCILDHRCGCYEHQDYRVALNGEDER